MAQKKKCVLEVRRLCHSLYLNPPKQQRSHCGLASGSRCTRQETCSAFVRSLSCLKMAEEITECEMALGLLFSVFMEKQGDDGKLTKQAFLQLLNEQIPSFKAGGKNIGEEIFKGVDFNQDGAVDFQEFAMMIAGYASMNFAALQQVMKKSKKGK
ncbi:PREDICTED: protein S100-A11-like isoform X1 [Poecilia mexicana]|uniref:protein S100-A11-like isoform X1 n=2 Tax=Poecilia mexicana TaxID=48701 RepID=UPI00072E492C|nr:PREDICTED: protein S100-A11-like isoform X1 [Poecilia mexicana]